MIFQNDYQSVSHVDFWEAMAIENT